MQSIPIQPIPNQSFSVTFDANQWDVVIKSTNGTISVSLTLNGDVVVENARAVGNEPIIQSEYQENGNFLIAVQNFEIPDYQKFGVTQLFVYVTQAELDAANAPPPIYITASFFNSDAALPLRFKPMGYTS